MTAGARAARLEGLDVHLTVDQGTIVKATDFVAAVHISCEKVMAEE